MILELFLSVLCFPVVLAMAYACRSTYTSIHLAALAILTLAMPIFRWLAGTSPWPFPDTVLYLVFGGTMLYAGLAFFTTVLFPNRDLIKTIDWLRNFHSTDRMFYIVLGILLALWSSRIYKGVVYNILYSGSSTEDAVLGLPYWFVAADSIINLLGGGALIYGLLMAIKGTRRWLLWIIALELLWSFLSGGRRELAFMSIVYVTIAWYIKAISFRNAAFVLMFAAGVMFFASPLFLTVRNYNSNYQQYEGIGTFSALGNAIGQAFEDCGVVSGCLYLVSENIAERGNTLEFTKEIANSRLNGYSSLDGLAFLNSLAWAIPSSIHSKPELMVEQFIQANLGLPLGDDSVSIVAMAYAELGLFGCVFYGLGVGLLIRLCSWTLIRKEINFLALAMLFGLCRVVATVEGDLTSYFVFIRDCAIILLSASLWHLVSNRGSLR